MPNPWPILFITQFNSLLLQCCVTFKTMKVEYCFMTSWNSGRCCNYGYSIHVPLSHIHTLAINQLKDIHSDKSILVKYNGMMLYVRDYTCISVNIVTRTTCTCIYL